LDLLRMYSQETIHYEVEACFVIHGYYPHIATALHLAQDGMEPE